MLLWVEKFAEADLALEQVIELETEKGADRCLQCGLTNGKVSGAEDSVVAGAEEDAAAAA